MDTTLLEMDEMITGTDSVFRKMEISWDKISVWTAPKRSCFRQVISSVQVLHSISGKVEPGKLVAIMGPSGSGKTTLLNILTGRNLSNYSYEGTVMLNKEPAKLTMMKSFSGYVQQGDLFVPMLTVRETLQFVSLVRMEEKFSPEKRERRINEVLTELELIKCADSRIGNRIQSGSTGISGGELRRLSFACEMLTNPSLLFCDEPTSGLDSHLAESVVNILKKMSQSGRTIIVTIHQPSSEVFILFDKLLLLSQGKLAFFGTNKQANDFFASLNFICPNNFNPADFYLKQLSLIPGRKEECLKRIENICEKFAEQQHVQLKSIDDDTTIKSNFTVEINKTPKSIYKVSGFKQFQALLWRSFISIIREPMIARIKLSQTITVALLLGIIYWRQELNQKAIMNINGAIFVLIINQTFMNVFSVINTFCEELPLFLREHSNGMYRVDAYFFAKMISEFPYQILFPSMFVIIMFFMVGFHNTVYTFFIFLFVSNLIANSGISFGYMISCLSSTTKIAIALSSPLILPLLLFGGFFVNNDTIPAWLKWFKYISWFYYGNEALVIAQWKDITNITCPSILPVNQTLAEEQRCITHGISVIKELNFNPDHIEFDILLLIILILVFRTMAFLFLFLRARQR